MSRLPRSQEHLKTGFIAEAASAARLRAYAARAEEEGLPKLARRLRELAGAKDALAILQLGAAGQVRGALADVREALSEEEFENDVLYPKMAREVDPETAAVFEEVVASQRQHARSLTELRQALQESQGDVS